MTTTYMKNSNIKLFSFYLRLTLRFPVARCGHLLPIKPDFRASKLGNVYCDYFPSPRILVICNCFSILFDTGDIVRPLRVTSKRKSCGTTISYRYSIQWHHNVPKKVTTPSDKWNQTTSHSSIESTPIYKLCDYCLQYDYCKKGWKHMESWVISNCTLTVLWAELPLVGFFMCLWETWYWVSGATRCHFKNNRHSLPWKRGQLFERHSTPHLVFLPFFQHFSISAFIFTSLSRQNWVLLCQPHVAPSLKMRSFTWWSPGPIFRWPRQNAVESANPAFCRGLCRATQSRYLFKWWRIDRTYFSLISKDVRINY